MKVTFVIPAFNISMNLDGLLQSLYEQDDRDWNAIIIDDMSDDSTRALLSTISDTRVSIVINDEKKFALRNIVETCDMLEAGSVAAIIDGDDRLCNPKTVTILKDAHATTDVVWTAHRWDINGLNVSCALPEKVNPYQYQWCSSHLKSFKVDLLRAIPKQNFKDHKGRWFERGYDQALMLPLLYKADNRKYVDEVCYFYNINSCSINDRDWAEAKQLRVVNLVRSRGYIAV